jgi:DNA-3-methyladenine glycosylase I
MIPPHGWDPKKPDSLAGYLEAMSRPVFSTGINWRVVDAKLEGMRAAFHGFDPERVAAMTEDDIDRLVQDPRIIRNRKKIEATIDNAETLLVLDRGHDGFENYLSSWGSFEETVAALRRDFRFLGESGCYLFLWSVEQPVPPHEEWTKTHERRPRRNVTRAS